MTIAAHTQLLDTFPLVRSQNVEDARERIGRFFSPHRLELHGKPGQLDVAHNQVRLARVSLNVLHYGAQVLIDPGERGDFYMVQLPLSGSAQLACGTESVSVDPGVLSVLQPHIESRMVWSGDCTMLLLQVPRSVVHERTMAWGIDETPRFALAHSRQVPEVAAWWQAVLDLTRNIDRFGDQWLRHPAAYAALEEFLLSAFTALLSPPDAARCLANPGDARCLRRAKEYIHANPERALRCADIASHACVSPRTLEAVFKRCGEVSPLAYARRCRLQAVHEALRLARHEGRAVNVTEVALSYGFLHMGRFAAQYREQFACSPSETLRPH
ncbi:AraC family transcriptional regulator [Verminephrobacter eiseniae]|uniref:AraC family transcriptional regulator n=1 Tax=Verminephrobacter eiseniae TaxID=364317 RepID=UPI002237270A|nr:AraC family transcriptional regulator [Verminephrobacter eiseniae]MCW5262906.1 AraC family transcriptional regulator [Verminephrobacter eiseniae]